VEFSGEFKSNLCKLVKSFCLICGSWRRVYVLFEEVGGEFVSNLWKLVESLCLICGS
jgi:hypothetical protein